jgi:hypothetical protein
VVFAGPGLGIFLTGLLALFSHLLPDICHVVADLCRRGAGDVAGDRAIPAPAHPDAPPLCVASHRIAASATGVVYALYGVGYIIPATFLSQMANAQFHGQWQADLFWPCFGLGAAIGVLLVSLRRHDPTPRGTG